MLIVDSPAGWRDKSVAVREFTDTTDRLGTRSRNAALFFPRLRRPNPLRDNQLEDFAPCGAVAGVIARTDSQRGVWKAPAGLDASLAGVAQLTVKFVSELISATRDRVGEVISGDPKRIKEVTDIWTFAREVASRNPNWKLIATQAAN